MKNHTRIVQIIFPTVFAAVVVCCTANIWNLTPRFPDDHNSWEIPLLSPLTEGNLFVQGAIEHLDSEGKTQKTAIVFLVDSGASSNSVSRETFDMVGIDVKRNNNVRVTGAGGEEQAWRGGIMDYLILGNLRLRQVGAFMGTGKNVIGNAILAEHPWEVDYERGVIVINSAEWADVKGARTLNLQAPFQLGVDAVKAKLNGKSVFLILDTGASNTSLDNGLAKDFGLTKRQLPKEEEELYGTANRKIRVRAHYSIDNFVIDRQSFGSQVFRPMWDFNIGPPMNTKVGGLLGMDFLSGYNFRIDPGNKLQLKDRLPTRSTTVGRIARWGWVKSCDDKPGCAVSTIQRTDSGATTVSLELFAVYGESASYLFGCLGEDGNLLPGMPLVQIHVRVPGQNKMVIELSEKDFADVDLDPNKDDLAVMCPSPELLDINPLSVGVSREDVRKIIASLPEGSKKRSALESHLKTMQDPENSVSLSKPAKCLR